MKTEITVKYHLWQGSLVTTRREKRVLGEGENYTPSQLEKIIASEWAECSRDIIGVSELQIVRITALGE